MSLKLITDIELITDEHKKGDKEIITFNEGELAIAIWAHIGWWDKHREHFIDPEPLYYLPNGMSSPEDAIEVEEYEVDMIPCPAQYFNYYVPHIGLCHDTFGRYDKAWVAKIPTKD